MQRVILNLLDHHEARHRWVPMPVAEALIAALTAEPESLAELEAAARRFMKPVASRGWFESWAAGTSLVAGADACFVDLAARAVVCQAENGKPARQGYVVFQLEEDEDDDAIRVWFQLSDDWLFSSDVGEWKSLLEERRRQQPQNRIDERTVLYERLVEFLVHESLAAAAKLNHQGRKQSRSRRESRSTRTAKKTDDEIRKIHARWLTTPRHDLRDRTPREVLLEKREWIDFDLQSRRDQWSLTGTCPPGIADTTSAYQFAGFGTQENVMHYELVRHLLDVCWKVVNSAGHFNPAEMIRQLEEEKDAWLHAPQPGLTGNETPHSVIHLERSRIPLAVSGEDAMIDCDCPLCQMMADEGPAFVHFDQSGMDEDFVFSLYQSREQWEEERIDWDELEADDSCLPATVDFQQEESECAETGGKPRPGGPWQRSFVVSACEGAEGVNPEIQLIGIAAHLAELGMDLNSDARTAGRAKTLNQHFKNLRESVRNASETLVEAAVERLCNELLDVASDAPEHADKCGVLHQQLTAFGMRLP